MSTYIPAIALRAHPLGPASAPYPPGVAECMAPLMRPIPLPNVRVEPYFAPTRSHHTQDRRTETPSLCWAPSVQTRELASHHDCTHVFCPGRSRPQYYGQPYDGWNDLDAMHSSAPLPRSALPMNEPRLPYTSHFGSSPTSETPATTHHWSTKQRTYPGPQTLPYSTLRAPLSHSPLSHSPRIANHRS